jgi:WD40 repeat protein
VITATISGANDLTLVYVPEPEMSVVSAASDNTLMVWDLETSRKVRTLTGHSYSVNSVAVTPDGRHAVSGSSDKTLKVWDLQTGLERQTLVGHSDSVHGVAVHSDGRRVVSASGDNTLKVWDLETGDDIAVFSCDSGAECCAYVNCLTIVVGDSAGRVHFLSLELPARSVGHRSV